VAVAAGHATGSDNGTGWVGTYAPRLPQADGPDGDSLTYVANGLTAYYYHLVNGAYRPRLDDLSKLTYTGGGDTFTLTDLDGDQHVFSGLGPSRPAAQRGEPQSYTDADGVAVAVTAYTPDGHVAETQRTATGGRTAGRQGADRRGPRRPTAVLANGGGPAAQRRPPVAAE
jgi:hypothetical protein